MWVFGLLFLHHFDSEVKKMSLLHKITIDDLKQKQNYPLKLKIELSKNIIRKFYVHFDGKVYVSFSGGKDSTVLLHLVRSLFPEVEAVFSNTGLEYPDITKFVKTIPNVTWLYPKKTFKEVINDYGYPIISKEQAHYIHQYTTGKTEHTRNMRWNGINGKFKISEKWKFLCKAPFRISSACCDILKKNPIKQFNKRSGKHAFIGTMACDSNIRERRYLQEGCISYKKIGLEFCTPLAFWTQNDIWEYIEKYKVSYCDIYNKGIEHTGCAFCLFGIQYDKGKRFRILKKLYPKLFNFCMDKLEIKKVLNYFNDNVPEKDKIIFDDEE